MSRLVASSIIFLTSAAVTAPISLSGCRTVRTLTTCSITFVVQILSMQAASMRRGA